MSCWAACQERARLRAGETVLINGATGAAGRLAVQIARHLGAAKVIATGRDRDALKEVAALGADATIPLVADAAAPEEAFGRHFAAGVDVVIDYLWGPSAERLLIAAATAGKEGAPMRFVQVGSASGSDITLPSAVLRASAITLMGSGIGSVSPWRASSRPLARCCGRPPRAASGSRPGPRRCRKSSGFGARTTSRGRCSRREREGRDGARASR